MERTIHAIGDSQGLYNFYSNLNNYLYGQARELYSTTKREERDTELKVYLMGDTTIILKKHNNLHKTTRAVLLRIVTNRAITEDLTKSIDEIIEAHNNSIIIEENSL